MAEKVTIFELDIDIDSSKRDLEDLRLSVNELKKGLKELSDAEKENNKQLDEQRKRLKELQSQKKKDIKSISETQANIDKLLKNRRELNKSIVDQTTVLKTNQSQLRQGQKVIQDATLANDKWNQELQEEKIRLQEINKQRQKTIREGIKLAAEKKELALLQNKQNKSEAELIRLNNLLVKQRKNMVVRTKAERKEYNRLTIAISKNNKELLRQNKSIGRYQRNVHNYTNALRGLFATFGLTGGIVALNQLLSRSVDAYKAEIVEVAKLTTIVKERTNATDAEVQSILNLTNAQQQQGIIGNEIANAGAQQIATFVTEIDTIKTLIPALNDLLAQRKGVNATQEDAVSIGNLFGKTLQGEVTALKRVGVSFTDAQKEILKFGTESEKAATLAEVIKNNVGDLNEELLKTDIGQLKNLENQLGDLEEKLGEAILPALTKWKQLQLDIANALSSLVKGYDVAGFAIAKARTKEFVEANKLLSIEEKRINIQRRLYQIEKEIAETKKIEREARKKGKAGQQEISESVNRRLALKEEKKLLIELGKTGFFIKELKEKEIEKTKEQIEAEKELTEVQKKAAAERRKRAEEKRKREEEERKREEEKRYQEEQDQLDKILEEQIRKKQEAKDKIERLKAETAERQKQKQITDQENELALLETNILGELEAERRRLELKEQQEIEFAERIGANTTLIEEKYSNAKQELARAEKEAKLSLAAEFFGNVATIAGEGTAIAKAAAVAETTINTYKSATAAYSALAGTSPVGPFLGAAAAAAAVVAGLANVRKILSVKTDLPGSSSIGTGTVPSIGSATPAATRAAAIAPEINQGIISRSTFKPQDVGKQAQTAVIIDEVTAKQNEQSANNNTSVI